MRSIHIYLVLFFALEGLASESFLPTLDAIEDLLDSGTDVNAIFDPSSNSTLLHLAVLEKKHRIVKILISSGANPLLKNAQGFNSLNLATTYFSEKPQLIDLLTKASLSFQAKEQVYPCRPPPPRNSKPSCNNSIEETFSLIQDGEEDASLLIQEGDEQDVVMVVGNTGSGKSTVTHFLLGDNDKLHAVKLSDGKLIIADEGVHSKIGHSTVSHTLLPELTIDPETQTRFYDCPGFSDTRCSSFDIAAQYFIKKVLDSVRSVKFLVVVDHASVTKGGSRTDFPLLIKHLSKLIKNVDKFRSSLYMVVTKAPVYSPSTGEELSEDSIVEGISEFIKATKHNLRENEEGYKNKLDLIETFLETRANSSQQYPRISVLRNANRCGPVSTLRLWQNVKGEMKSGILNYTKFAPAIKQDFGFTISDTSISHVGVVAREADAKLKSSVENLSRTTWTQVYASIEASPDIFEKQGKISQFFDIGSTTLPRIQNRTDFLEILKDIVNMTQKLNISIPQEFISKPRGVWRLLLFLEEIAPDQTKYDGSISVWTSPLEATLLQPLEKLQDWNGYLLNLYDKLISYSFQNDATARREIERIRGQNMDTDNAPFSNFVESSPILQSIYGYSSIKSIPLTVTMAEQLKQLIRFGVEGYSTKSTRPGNHILVGNILRVGDISKQSTDLDTPNSTLTVISPHTIFIDEDIQAGGVNLAILSPKWVVLGSKKINLTGLEGLPHSSPSAGDSNHNFKKGDDGLPGNAGGNGGSFLGYVGKGEGLDILSISVKGGQGGPGMGGGTGGPGSDGVNAYWDPDWHGGTRRSKSEYIMKDFPYRYNYDFERGFQRGAGNKGGEHYDRFWLKLYGGPRKVPGTGGDGGQGGFGGRSGSAQINANSTILAGQGEDGVGGVGGASGKCSRDGSWYETWVVTEDIHAAAVFSFGAAPAYKYEILKPSSKDIRESPCISGESGKTGENTLGKKNPTPAADPNFPSSITSFKLNLLESQSKYPIISSLFSTARKTMEEDSFIASKYQVVNLFSDFASIEDFFTTTKNTQSSQETYSYLLKRIENAAKSSSTTFEEEKALAWLYTAVLSKLISIQDAPIAIVNVADYFKILKENSKNILTLKHSQLITQQTESFNGKTNELITEGMDHIQERVLPEIKSIEDKLVTNIFIYANNTIDQQNKTYQEIDKLQKEKIRLQNQGILKIFYSVLKVVGTIASAFGPIGKAAGGLINAGVGIAEGFTIKASNFQSSDGGGLPQISPNLKGLLVTMEDSTKEYTKEKGKAIKSQIDALKDAHEKYPQQLKGIDEDITKLSKDLENMEKASAISNFENQKVANDIANKIEAELEAKIEEKENLLIAEKENPDKIQIEEQDQNKTEAQSDTVLTYLKHAGSAVAIGSAIIGTVSTVQQNSNEIAKIDAEIKNNKIRVKQLREFEDSLYTSVIPAIVGMGKELYSAEERMRNKSRIALDVGKWKVGDMIKNMRLDLKKTTKDFDLQEDVLHTMDKLDEVMSLLANVYDRIQVYQEKKQLTQFISLISNPEYQSIQLQNSPEFSQLFTKVKLSLKSNILISQYSEGIVAFNQLMYPFAQNFAADLLPPAILTQTDTDLSTLVDLTVEKIDKIEGKLALYKATVYKIDEHIITGEFSSDIASSTPFYTWSSVSNPIAIKSLLQGKPVTLKAHPDQGAVGRNSVKFTEIKLSLKWRNDAKKEPDQGIMQELAHFQIRMIHHGQSYYRTDEEIGKEYVVRGNPLEFLYTNSSSGLVNDKLARGDFLLSPYAMWTFTIQNIPGKPRSFQKLVEFAGNVDLELVGRGRYLNDNSLEFGNLQLNKYYEVVQQESLGSDPFQEKYKLEF